MSLKPLLSLVLILFQPGCQTPRPEAAKASSREISVAAAADLKFAMDDLCAGFRKRHQNIDVTVSYGSSGNFHSQLQNQAPFDIFLSADLQFPRKLSEQGLTLPDSEFVYAVGRIVVWIPAGSSIEVEKLGMSSLQHPAVTHIAIANPQHAPYGRAAEAAMKSLGVYDSVKPKLVFGENVAQTLQFVESGNAQIGIVALSLALSPGVRAQGRFWEVPLDKYPRMDQGGVIMRWAKDPDAARALRTFMISPEGRMILEKYGFFRPGSSPKPSGPADSRGLRPQLLKLWAAVCPAASGETWTGQRWA